ncbi:Uncharacterized protein Fot_49709 [Forsythia ovata]|uniref:Uncharacterized protein n=1 Tax=Forsythia ovata TaxID=205694 RepID=A0ABD1QCM9_9LAMI
MASNVSDTRGEEENTLPSFSRDIVAFLTRSRSWTTQHSPQEDAPTAVSHSVNYPTLRRRSSSYQLTNTQLSSSLQSPMLVPPFPPPTFPTSTLPPPVPTSHPQAFSLSLIPTDPASLPPTFPTSTLPPPEWSKTPSVHQSKPMHPPLYGSCSVLSDRSFLDLRSIINYQPLCPLLIFCYKIYGYVVMFNCVSSIKQYYFLLSTPLVPLHHMWHSYFFSFIGLNSE